MPKKKSKKLRVLFLILCLLFLSVYGGMKAGEYLAQKLTKPAKEAKEQKSALEGAKGEGKFSMANEIGEDDKAKLVMVVTEFINAEHYRANPKLSDSKLSDMVEPNYYNQLLKEIKSIKSGQVDIQNLNYKTVSGNEVKVEVQYLKSSKKMYETITLKRSNDKWKVVKVDERHF